MGRRQRVRVVFYDGTASAEAGACTWLTLLCIFERLPWAQLFALLRDLPGALSGRQ